MTCAVEVTGAAAPRPDPTRARAIIRKHSKSFSLASLLLGHDTRADAEALYAYCRRADDAIDLVLPQQAPVRLRQLWRELDDVYAGRACSEPVLSEFQRLVFEKGIPREYPQALLLGFQSDVEGASYETLSELHRYCWYVAGSVGAMMCHVTGVRRPRSVAHGVHLGMAMQLTNICRDVAEDWGRGRLYLPKEMVPGLAQPYGSREIPCSYLPVLGRAVSQLLAEAERFYRSGDLGLPYLAFRSRVAVAAARQLYSGIGEQILAGGADVLAARAVVPMSSKVWRVGLAAAASIKIALTAPRFRPATLTVPIRFPHDVLPL